MVASKLVIICGFFVPQCEKQQSDRQGVKSYFSSQDGRVKFKATTFGWIDGSSTNDQLRRQKEEHVSDSLTSKQAHAIGDNKTYLIKDLRSNNSALSWCSVENDEIIGVVDRTAMSRLL